MTSSLIQLLARIDWWKVLWPVFFASGGLFVLSSRFEKIVKGQFHKWHLFRISKRKTSKRNSHATVAAVRTVQISSIHIHPIKSLRPVSVSSAKLTSRGMEGDRCLMLVRPSPSSGQYRFLTQRQCPQLATIHASLPRRVGNTTMMEISNFDHSRKMLVDISYSNIVQKSSSHGPHSVKYYKAGIWDDVVQVVDLGDEASFFVQSLIASNHDNDDDNDYHDEDYSNVRLVMQVPNDNRRVDERYCPLAALDVIGRVPKVSLTDGFPILIASEESLQELNRRLVEKGKDAIPMSRFRPNIVVKGTVAAFDEDEWKAIQIVGNSSNNNDDDNGPILHVVKGCPRCKQSCTDQITGERFEEPLETLKDFRALGTTNKEDVYFAQNVVLQPGHEGKEISVGDTVRILTRGRPVWDMGVVQAE